MNESVWDYPRPPAVVPEAREAVVEFNGLEIARSRNALRVLETSHPPTIYIPPDDVDFDSLKAASGVTVCEFKGEAHYFDVVVEERRAARAAWSYPDPASGYEALAGAVAFYPGRVDRCTLGAEVVTAQAGDFYGGWITGEVTGPFKGGPGPRGW